MAKRDSVDFLCLLMSMQVMIHNAAFSEVRKTCFVSSSKNEVGHLMSISALLCVCIVSLSNIFMINKLY